MDRIVDGQTRVIIYACVTDLPGSPLARHFTLGNLFCNEVLKRPLNARLNPSGYDHMYIPPGFDSERPVKRWFIYDLEVTGTLSKEEVREIPHLVFFASRQDDRWVFIPRQRSIEAVRRYCLSYFWGGRREQELVAEMRRERQKAECEPEPKSETEPEAEHETEPKAEPQPEPEPEPEPEPANPH